MLSPLFIQYLMSYNNVLFHGTNPYPDTVYHPIQKQRKRVLLNGLIEAVKCLNAFPTDIFGTILLEGEV